MNSRDEDLNLENVDERIEQLIRTPREHAGAPEPLADLVRDLQGVYDEERRLEHVWERISSRAQALEGTVQPHSREEPINQQSFLQGEQKIMRNPLSSPHPGSFQDTPDGPFQPQHRRSWSKFGLALAAAAVLIAGFIWTISAVYHGTQTGSGGSTPILATPIPATPTTGTATVPLTVTSVDMAVSPHSISGYACGATVVIVTYTATFHFPAHNAGGQVAFYYTTNNGRSNTQASLTVKLGQTSVPYQFTWSGALPADHTMPEPGGVMVTSPNAYTSQLVAPSGACSPTTSAPFKVNSIEVAASPALNGQPCGSQFTETYTATFHIAPNSPGGTIVFIYTINNGRGNSQNVSLVVAAGQTTATYQFTWSGALPADHTMPEPGGVIVTAPNQIVSTGGVPIGQCR